ncbi:MAG: SIMPL domain-containing protein [Geminicoccaceae bacterium]
MRTKPILVLGLLMTAFLASPSAWAGDDQRRITVTGKGEAKVVPDIALMSIGVETEARAPSEALSENASRMTAVMAKLKDAGIAEKDMQTRQLSIWPVYTDRSQSNTPPKISGYRAGNQLSVTLRDIERIGEILDQTVADGANTVNGPSFSVAEPEPLYQEARDAAVKDAIAKAERYAKAAGVPLGEIISISEAGGGPVMARQMRVEAMAASTPVAAGESTFSASVTMVFAIGG